MFEEMSVEDHLGGSMPDLDPALFFKVGKRWRPPKKSSFEWRVLQDVILFIAKGHLVYAEDFGYTQEQADMRVCEGRDYSLNPKGLQNDAATFTRGRGYFIKIQAHIEDLSIKEGKCNTLETTLYHGRIPIVNGFELTLDKFVSNMEVGKEDLIERTREGWILKNAQRNPVTMIGLCTKIHSQNFDTVEVYTPLLNDRRGSGVITRSVEALTGGSEYHAWKFLFNPLVYDIGGQRVPNVLPMYEKLVAEEGKRGLHLLL